MITTLSQLIAQVESHGNPLAVRFEPAHKPFARFIAGMAKVADCSLATAQILCRMSWGKYQVMGDNLIDLGMNDSPLQYCASVTQQDYFFLLFLNKHAINFTLDEILHDEGKRHDFACVYNGPGNVEAYSQRMLDIYAQFGKA